MARERQMQWMRVLTVNQVQDLGKSRVRRCRWASLLQALQMHESLMHKSRGLCRGPYRSASRIRMTRRRKQKKRSRGWKKKKKKKKKRSAGTGRR